MAILQSGNNCEQHRSENGVLPKLICCWSRHIRKRKCDQFVKANFNDLVDNPSSTSLVDSNKKIGQALGNVDIEDLKKSIPVVDFVDSPQNLLSIEDRDKKLKQLSILISNGGQLPRPIIPIRSKFQVKVPKWTGPVNRKNLYGGGDVSENLKWLDTQTWPKKGLSIETSIKAVGKGRLDSCSCVSPRLVDCIKCHILTKRLCLQSNVGLGYKSWKFDEMGEAVAKSWTLKEQRKFELLVKMNPLWNLTNF
ncbi:hypothetical protein SO802_029336 [Lithocarpus litseifolius]|uniref:ELM2 domain-containing protein n=1 Tax=Lithocarpus litseifolius TaxID=425828 RepID=A0AAW2BTE3_9ROSI